jgi:hypothetical protein
MSKQDRDDQKSKPSRHKRETFEVLAVRLNCSENFNEHIVVQYDPRYKSAICRTVVKSSTWAALGRTVPRMNTN